MEISLTKKQVAAKCWYRVNVDKVKAASHAWYWANRERASATARVYRENNRAEFRERVNRSTWKKAGYPEPTRPKPEYCECCGREGSLRLDHCHRTGVFRGWLCNRCNLGIGQLGDTRESVAKAVQYLDRSVAGYIGSALG